MKSSHSTSPATDIFRIGGLSASSALSFIARHFENALIVFPSQSSLSLEDAKNALQYFLKLDSRSSECLLFPELPLGYTSIGGDPLEGFQRIKTQFKLSQKGSEKVFVLSTGIALSQKILPARKLEAAVLHLKKSEWKERDELIEDFLHLGFRKDELAEDQGFFSVRGHLIDVFPLDRERPVRIEFFGDEIISLREFDPHTQRSLSELETIEFLPQRELMISKKNRDQIRSKLKDMGDSQGISREERDEILWKLENHRELFEYRWLLPAFSDELSELSDYLPKNLPLILVDPEKLRSEIEESLISDQKEFEEQKKLAYPPESFRSFPNILNEARAHHLWSTISPHATNYQSMGFEDLRHRLTRAKSFEPLNQLLKEAQESNLRIQMVFRNTKKMDAVIERFGDSFPEIDWKLAELFPGYQSKTLQQIVITERDLFGSRRRRSISGSRVDAAQFLREFSDLQEGDYVVHDDHGIGRYRGLIKLNVGQAESEFILLEYAEQDKLYLPIYRVDKISRYVRGDGHAHPRLDRLGAQTFLKRKSKAKKDIFQIAHELIEIAAERKLHQIERGDIDEHAFETFCQGFTFDLTPDQDSAIRDVLEDLNKDYPMDRLICGDVGFGKTEVALRAAMYRLLQNVQVAVLAPTTLLVEQHYRQFQRRFRDTGFRIERLSRFVSSKDQKKILDDLKNGRIDLVIGTHRLLQRDVGFKNLGMLIVDEEQRFGVKHKERIKKLRSNLDILTLSATPIPRTLQMSIVGIRELSLIVTPPEIRESVNTYVGNFDEKLIREKAERERNRGGQIFFVHNRVKTIYGLKDRLEKVLPEYKIAVAHGQMNENELEDIMVGFMEGRYDVLLATSIIENGLDIPNANTLFVDHAEQFGLSDLYQLRGRVGRSHRKAFSFFLIHDDTPLTADASKRLQVLQSCTELGSGFRVATHDLEIRGAGNLLGEAQSGVIAEIGLELYNQMLHETLEEIRSGVHRKIELPEIRPGYSAFIPETYIPDPSIRISTYRRLNQLQNLHDLLNFEDELLDRFGLYPRELEILCSITKLRILTIPLKAKELDCSPGKLMLDFHSETKLDPMAVLKKFGSKVSFDPKGRLSYQFESATLNEDLYKKSAKYQFPELYDLAESQTFLLELLKLVGLDESSLSKL